MLSSIGITSLPESSKGSCRALVGSPLGAGGPFLAFAVDAQIKSQIGGCP